MDTKSLHCKHPKKKSNMDNDKHEVFVLPPDILKKLGISIGNINVSQVIPTDSNVSPGIEITSNQNIENILASNCSQNASDTSILETASLMKKSVFLSPTFIPTIANVIPGEVVIVNKNIIDDSIAVTDFLEAENSVFEVSDLLPERNDSQEQYPRVDQAHLTYNNTFNGGDKDYLHTPVDIKNICKEKQNEVKSRQDISDEAHSSRSNSNIKYVENFSDGDSTCVSYNNDVTGNPVSKLSKINIISEETIPLSKLRELKSLPSTINNLTPVTVNSVIGIKIKNENSNSEGHTICEQVASKSTELLHLDVNIVKSEVNTSKCNLISMPKAKCMQTNAVTMSSQIIEATSSSQTDIAMKENDTINTSEIKQDFEENSHNITNDKHKKGEDIFLESELSSNDIKDCNKTNEAIGVEHNKTSTDSVSVNVTTVNGFYGIDPDGINVDKLNKSSKFSNGQIYTNLEFEVNIENEHKNNEDNAEKPGANKISFNTKGTGIDNNLPNVTRSNLKQNSHSKYNNIQIGNSKAVDCDDNEKKSTEIKQKTVNNISSLKNMVDKSLRNDELTNILNATKELSNNNTNIKVDKVKEIAAYLKKFSHIYRDKKKIKKDLNNDNNKKEMINSNTNTIESKLCIQGVEKPGGNDVDRKNTGESKVLKTYTRRTHPENSKLLSKNLETYDTVDASCHELNTVNVATTCEIQEFCLCNDFGRLAYYDYDSLYEHIHFWQKNTATCDLDLIFAIYSDESIVNNNESRLEIELKTEENVEANICWNVFRNEFPEDVDHSEPENIWPIYVIDELKNDCFGNSLQVSELNNVIAQKENNSIVSKTHDQAQMITNNSNSNIILETIEIDMANATESKDCDSINHTQSKENLLDAVMHDKIVSAVVTIADSEGINNDSSALKPKSKCTSASITESSEISSNIDKVSIGGCDVIEGNENHQPITTKADINNKYQHKETDSNASKSPRADVKSDVPRTYGKVAPKRTLSAKISPEYVRNSNDGPASKKNIRCGLCNNLFSKADWEDHVTNQHHLIAWRAGNSVDLGNPDLLNKLKQRLKTMGLLKCSICGMETKKFNVFMQHIKYCLHQKLTNPEKKTDKTSRKSRMPVNENVTCGVCQQTFASSGWFEHIGRSHAYLAWVEGQNVLNFEDESVVLHHLQNIIRVNGKLTCYKCGFHRSRAKLYLAHVKTCDGSETYLDESSASIDLNSTSNLSTSILETEKNVEQPAETTIVKCGVCKRDVEILKWIDHIAKEHNYLAWQDDDTPVDLDDEEAVWNHLQQFIRQNGGLICHKCGLTRRRVKLYLTHVEECDGTGSQHDISFNNISMDSSITPNDQWYDVPVISEKKVVKCGVCSLEVPILGWIEHNGEEHDYLAWQDGSPPLNLEDESAVRLYLLNLSKQIGGLTCRHCKKKLKYSKTYLQHIKECSAGTVSLDGDTLDENGIKQESVMCGVCSTNVERCNWLDHIQSNHQYIAWIEGEPPLDVNDSAMIQRHLHDVSKKMGGLACAKCGVRRKYVKAYQHHLDTCHGKASSGELPLDMISKELLECAMCSEKVVPKDWRDHAMKKHYNITWVVGETPIELNNPYGVESYLKEYYHRYNQLVCKVCGISRVSYVGFYAHIIVCGKTDEETEMYKSTCDICNNKYLRIYKSQHMTMHREKEYAMERKLLAAKEKELKKEEESEESVIQTGRRKAAEKAKTVIEKYKNSFHDGSYHCSKCGFSSDIEKELSDHVCVENKWGDASDSDESVKLDNCSEDESDETDIDSNVSDEEREAREEASSNKKKRYSDSTHISNKISRLPYEVHNVSAYMKKSTEEFAKMYFTSEPLFTQWRNFEFEEVPENEVTIYIPPIEESCKVRFDSEQDWMSFNRLKSKRVKDTIVMFVGASIQCMSWLPAVEGGGSQYMAVASHAGADVPRYAWDEHPSAHGLLQIWDCGNVITSTPQFVLGIVHDYGTVWAIDWCPSGARDKPDLESESNEIHRLGLLAVACSNGSAYIFCVPYPSSITKQDKLYYRLKPVAEMRLTSDENRKRYQATAIKWSTQKGHSQIVVGYADGSTAFYDLNSESPLLRTTENNITVFYPYHDERVQNSCIEDVDMYPSGGVQSARAGGVVCVGSAGGAGAGALQSHVAAARVLFPPHWPAALLAGDDCLVNQSINELEWWGGGRRLGGMRGAAGCAWCGRLAAAALPLLRLLRTHPAYPDVHKQVIGTIQMTPLGGKRKRQNDELAMIVEPITYGEAVKKYGIEFKQITARDRSTQQKLSAMPRDAYPERFPLSDVAAMQFCPTFKLHHKLALAMHAGIIIIINI